VASGNKELVTAAAALERFTGSGGLTSRISELESSLRGLNGPAAASRLSSDGIEDQTSVGALAVGALAVKAMAGQINVIVHALGILMALPAILEDGERVEDLSLGAGNTGHNFDLETNRRIAEFKFCTWQGGSETIRQNALFVDLYHLAEAETDKLRELYVTYLVHPLRFLAGGRSMKSILSKHGHVAEEFFARYGDRYLVARDYWNDAKDRVGLVDVSTLVPSFAKFPFDEESI
jgi:hypothetical protein